jgi:hypothetical protein
MSDSARAQIAERVTVVTGQVADDDVDNSKCRTGLPDRRGVEVGRQTHDAARLATAAIESR